MSFSYEKLVENKIQRKNNSDSYAKKNLQEYFIPEITHYNATILLDCVTSINLIVIYKFYSMILIFF